MLYDALKKKTSIIKFLKKEFRVGVLKPLGFQYRPFGAIR